MKKMMYVLAILMGGAHLQSLAISIFKHTVYNETGTDFLVKFDVKDASDEDVFVKADELFSKVSTYGCHRIRAIEVWGQLGTAKLFRSEEDKEYYVKQHTYMPTKNDRVYDGPMDGWPDGCNTKEVHVQPVREMSLSKDPVKVGYKISVR